MGGISLPSSEEILAALVGGGVIGWIGRALVAREKRLGFDHEVAAERERERERMLADERAARIAQAGEVQRALVALAESIASSMTKNHETHDVIVRRFEKLLGRVEELAKSKPTAASETSADRSDDHDRARCPRCGRELEGDPE